ARLLGGTEPGTRRLGLALPCRQLALPGGLVTVELRPSVGEPRQLGLKLCARQLLLAHAGRALPVVFALAIERGPAACQALARLAERSLRRLVGRPGVAVQPGGLFAPCLGVPDRGAQFGEVVGGYSPGEVVELGEQRRSGVVQLALLGLDRGALLGQGADLGRERGIVRAHLEHGAPCQLELAARLLACAL